MIINSKRQFRIKPRDWRRGGEKCESNCSNRSWCNSKLQKTFPPTAFGHLIAQDAGNGIINVHGCQLTVVSQVNTHYQRLPFFFLSISGYRFVDYSGLSGTPISRDQIATPSAIISQKVSQFFNDGLAAYKQMVRISATVVRSRRRLKTVERNRNGAKYGGLVAHGECLS